jgi:hypothetical protein
MTTIVYSGGAWTVLFDEIGDCPAHWVAGWTEAASGEESLGPRESGAPQRMCRAIREAGALSEDAGYFLVSWAAEKLANDEVTRLSDPLRTLNVFEGGLDFDRILGDLPEGHGEAGMANLFRTNPEEHDRRREADRLFFFKPDDQGKDDATGWLDGLLRAVAAKVIASKPVAGLAYRHCPDEFVLQLQVCLPAGADGPAATVGCGFGACPATAGAAFAGRVPLNSSGSASCATHLTAGGIRPYPLN